MAYQVLARKWRPRDFDSVVGQEHVVRALRHALRDKRIHHAYLFTGTRGVGKTTLSRILAKCLNCTGPDGKGGITEKPCGQCEACRAIDAGHFVDYIEMDAASNRGVDEMTALLEQAMYPPTNARFKVYMIDEVHQLSNTAFNAMLKTLEEPPEYVKFILATTDPQKVPVTVLSRCLQFNLRNMTPQEVAGHMGRILQVEKIEAEPQALSLLAAGARGSMRDGLSLLDQAIAFSDGKVTLEGVRSMLGVVDSSVLLELLRRLAGADAQSMMRIADEMGQQSFSYGQALRDLAGILHRAALAQRVPASTSGDPEAEGIREIAGLFSPEEIQLYYQIAINGRNELHLAPDEYAGFTMTLLRMLAFQPAGSRDVPARAPVAPAPAPSPRRSPSPAAPPAQAAAAPAAPEPRPRQEEQEDLPPWVRPEADAAPASAPAQPSGIPSWQDLVEKAGLAGLERQAAIRCECLSVSERGVTLVSPAKGLLTEKMRKALETAFSDFLGRKFVVEVREGEVSGPTIWERETRERSERQSERARQFRETPLVKAIVGKFSGTVDDGSVRDAGEGR